MSEIINKDKVVGEGYVINHNFAENEIMKIVSIKDSIETVIFEAKVASNYYINLKATITDRELSIP